MTKEALTTSDVAIKQAVVEIKVLKIGNKQVTQAVFKQLLEEHIIDPDTGKLQGDAWGRVNYHANCEHLPREHVHVVWQKGDELRRAAEAIGTNRGYARWREDVRLWSYQYVITRILEGSEEPYNLTPPFSYDHPYPEYVNLYLEPYDETITVGLHDGEAKAWDNKNSWWGQMVEKKRRVPSWNSQDIFERLCNAVDARDEYGNILARSYDHLQQLDQLFIAV